MKKMKISERIAAAIAVTRNSFYENDNVDRLIALAYEMGREAATKEVSDKYRSLLEKQKIAAKACRYHEMAKKIVGDAEYIYCSGYRGDITSLYGDEETDIE